jgi:hypothetical protein
MPRNTYLVCYDICDDKRLREVFKTMRDFGDHLQYSIFDCHFTPTDLVRCRHALGEIMPGASRGRDNLGRGAQGATPRACSRRPRRTLRG